MRCHGNFPEAGVDIAIASLPTRIAPRLVLNSASLTRTFRGSLSMSSDLATASQVMFTNNAAISSEMKMLTFRRGPFISQSPPSTGQESSTPAGWPLRAGACARDGRSPTGCR